MAVQTIQPSSRKIPVTEQVAFHRSELAVILAVYGKMVAAGEWRDYGISMLRESESDMTFGGPIALGILALAADNEAQCYAALSEAEALLDAGSVGHNYLNFYEDAMEACLQISAWNEVDRYAQALEDYTRPEPLPRSDYFIERGRRLAAFGRGDRDDVLLKRLQELGTAAEKNGFHLSRRALDAAFKSA